MEIHERICIRLYELHNLKLCKFYKTLKIR